jgi:thioesterase domain-containing protein
MTAPVAADDPHAALGASARVRVELLRAGDSGERLFLVPGLEGDPKELADLVSSFAGPQQVHAVAPALEHPDWAEPDVPALATALVGAVREIQPAGPYLLGGYSFGGLLALEMAQQLRAEGQPVDALFLVDAVFDERFWPRGTWLRALVRRSGWQLARIVKLSPGRAVGELFHRAIRLARRVIRRTQTTGAPPPVQAADGVERARRAYVALGAYRPRPYDGRATLIGPAVDRHFGCDTIRLWAASIKRADVQRVDADHLTVMSAPGVAGVAAAIDHGLATLRAGWTGLRPRQGFQRPMIFTTMRWFSAARLAHAMIEAGFAVSACRPRGHALELVDGLTGGYRLGRLRQSRSLEAAIRRADPDIVLPDDERALVLLRRLHRRVSGGDPRLAALIEYSLGYVDSWSTVGNRAGLVNQARTLGVPAPDTAVLPDLKALAQWRAEHGLPVVLKTDGSWGGRGVKIVQDAIRLPGAWQNLSRPPNLPRALKRALLNREAGSLAAWARRTRPVVNAQEYVAGREAIATVACLGGEVLGVVCLEVVRAVGARGAAAVVRVIEHPGMVEAATRLVAWFGLNGFCGLDFILTDDGEARLLELNPRVTPTCYLLLEGERPRGQAITLFPALPQHAAVDGAIVDRPRRAPLLARRGEAMMAKKGRPMARMTSRLTQMSATRY